MKRKLPWILRIFFAIPLLPGMGGLFTNRRNPRSKICAPADVIFNISDTFYAWVYRMPKGGNATIIRDKDGKNAGSFNRLP